MLNYAIVAPSTEQTIKDRRNRLELNFNFNKECRQFYNATLT